MENFFASNLKYLRKLNKMTQLDLAKKMNKDYSTVGKWELNQRTPVMEDIIKIAKIFNVSILELIKVDLRFLKENHNYTIEEELFLLMKVLKLKGIIDDNEIITLKDFDRLMKFIENNKDLLIKKDRD